MSPTNGTVERYNRTMTTTLRKLMVERKIRIDDNIEKVCWDLFPKIIAGAHNNRISRRMKYSPNQLVLGKNIRLPKDLHYQKTKLTKYDIYNNYIKGCRLMAELDAKANLDLYDIKRKQHYDKRKKEPKFIIGDLVIWFKGKYPLLGRRKYQQHWHGPYEIIDIWNNDNNVTLFDRNNKDKFNTNITRIRLYNKVIERQKEEEKQHNIIETEQQEPIQIDDKSEPEIEESKNMEIDEDQLYKEENTLGQIKEPQNKSITHTVKIDYTQTRSVTPNIKLNDSQITLEEKQSNESKTSKYQQQ